MENKEREKKERYGKSWERGKREQKRGNREPGKSGEKGVGRRRNR